LLFIVHLENILRVAELGFGEFDSKLPEAASCSHKGWPSWNADPLHKWLGSYPLIHIATSIVPLGRWGDSQVS